MPEEAVDPADALRVSQAALGNAVGDYRLRDADGAVLQLSGYRGKPVVINLVYTACYHTCPIIVQTLADAVRDARAALGHDSFSVITIGFDTANDTPARMRAFAREQGIDLPNWRFAAIGGGDMAALAKDLGFIYFRSPKGFDHLAQVSIVDADGVLYRQVYGESFDSPFLVEPLKDLVFGRAAGYTSVDGLINRLRLFCTLYDPAAQRYRFDYSIFIGVGIGVVILTAIGTILIRAGWRQYSSGGRRRA